MLKMLKQRKNQIVLGVGAGLAALTLGAGAAVLYFSNLGTSLIQVGQSSIDQTRSLLGQPQSTVLSLALRSGADRASVLQMLAAGAPSADRNRARYLLAMDLIGQNKAGSALPYLQGLEQDYPILAGQILAKRAQVYAAAGDTTKATATWQDLLQRYPSDPAAAQALFAIGRSDSQKWNQLLAKFPAHPRSLEVAQAKLKQNPNQLQFMLILAKYGTYLPNVTAVLDRLIAQHAAQLKPEDWESIAFNYWENQKYSSAGRAYARAPRTPLNLYRTARGAQLGDRTEDARQAYYRLSQAFPQADETGLGLVRLASLVKSQDALPYIDAVIRGFPDRAPEALLQKAKIMDALGSPKAASIARQAILNQYSKSETAAQLRWRLAEQRSAAGDVSGAWTLARQIVSENPDSEYAPEAAFWVGKWAQRLGQGAQARTAFEYVLSHYPQSYYAWRSASLLGLDVGDFTTVRQRSPQVVKPSERSLLLSGSPALQELYQLGQNSDAWARWQVEFENFRQPSIDEQFTDGVMRLGVGDNLNGIFMVSNLRDRDKPADQAAYRELRQQTAYWQALYPSPYVETINSWAKQRQINPMLVTALIRQESRFEPKIESSAGAIGLMQVMPDTADWVAKQIGLKQYAMGNPNDNINLGTWYLGYTHQEYNDNSLFAVASYNAGPGSVADWITRFGYSDPDAFVEQIPFSETKGYIESVFGNYWNYMRLYDPDVSQLMTKYSSGGAIGRN